MLINALISLTESFVLYFVLGIAYLGWGRVVGRLLKFNTSSLSGLVNSVWMGWTVTLLIFQILNFWFPINVYVALPVFGVGMILSPKGLKELYALRPVRRQSGWIFLVLISIFIGVTVWVAKISMFSPTNYDSGLYHFQVIRWTNENPIIPGLGNLHSRLAFNQSFFTYVAALNFYPLFNHGRSIANSFLFLLTIVTFGSYLQPVFLNPGILFRSHPFRYLPSLFMLPFMGNLIIDSDGFASPSPDLPVVLLQVLTFVILAKGIAEWMSGNRDLDSDAALLAILAATSITVKLSNLVYAAAIFALIFLYLWGFPGKRLERNARFLYVPALILLIMCLRGYIFSGAPLFPSTVGFLPFAWAVPKEDAIDTANWIYSWARQDEKHWSEVLGNWGWVRPWVKKHSVYITDMIYPLYVTIVAGFASFIFSVFNKRARPKILEIALILPAGLGLLTWFFSAPDARFSKGLFFLLSTAALLVFLALIYSLRKRNLFVFLLGVAFLGGTSHLSWQIIRQDYYFRATLMATFDEVPEAEVKMWRNDSGLSVNIPAAGELCWDEPVPCAPSFKHSLALRKPGDLLSGFVIEP